MDKLPCSSTSSFACKGNSIQEKQKPKKKRRVATKNNINEDCHSIKKRTSIFRGVTRHRLTGRFEAHLWDKDSLVGDKKGRQVYLGACDNEEAAAITYDLASLKYWGPKSIEKYTNELEEMKRITKEEYLASLRRRSTGFSRGISKYRGVARHHQKGRWEARIGNNLGNKYLYLGTYSTQEEAAEAYDMAAIEHRGMNAVTNFDISKYIERLREKGVSIGGADRVSPLISSDQVENPHLKEGYHELEEDKVQWNVRMDADLDQIPTMEFQFGDFKGFTGGKGFEDCVAPLFDVGFPGNENGVA